MKVTKYPQSCLLLEKDGARVLVDLGTVATGSYSLRDFGELQAVLFTHSHPDHMDQAQIDQLLSDGVALYGNADVCGLIGPAARRIDDGQTVEIAGFQLTGRDLPHVEMVDGSPGPPNTGFVVDETLFHPGDGIELPDLRVAALAVPIAGPSVSFRDAYKFVESTGAQTVVPIHYDVFQADAQQFANFCDLARVVVLDHGEALEV